MPANPLSGRRSSPREAILELVVTWGAPADPAVAPLIAVLPRRFHMAEVLALVREKGRDVLPAALRDEMDHASAVLQAGGTAEAPSFRAHLSGLLGQAGEAIEMALLTERSELASLLSEHWEELGDGPIADTLGALWESTEDSTTAGRVAGIEQIRSAKAALSTAPSGTARTAGRPRDAAVPAAGSAASANAIEERFIGIVEAVKRAMEASPASGAGGATESRFLKALDRIKSAVLETAGEPDAASLFDLYEKEILPDQATQAQRARRQAEDRTALVASLTAITKEVCSAGDTASITDGAREQAAAGGAPYYEAVRTAAERLVAVRLKAATSLEASAATLRSAARDLEATLPKIAAQIPTQQVVESRLLLEQAAGVLQAGYREEIEAHAEAVRRRLEEARQISEARRVSSKERGERDRQSLIAAIGRLRAVAPARVARRLTRLETDLSGGGKGSTHETARRELDRIATVIEQEIRLVAAGHLAAARSWLKGRAAAADSPAAGLAAECDALAAALAGDDLAALRDQADCVRSLLWRARPWQRPAVRRAGAGAAAVLVAGLIAGWSLFQSRPHTIRLKLPPGSWETVWVVRDGHLVEERARGGENTGPEFRLAPGLYEIYVDRKYTGRRFSVPGEAVVKDIVPPHSPASAGPTGAGYESSANR
jgi:hypothetical protein